MDKIKLKVEDGISKYDKLLEKVTSLSTKYNELVEDIVNYNGNIEDMRQEIDSSRITFILLNIYGDELKKINSKLIGYYEILELLEDSDTVILDKLRIIKAGDTSTINFDSEEFLSKIESKIKTDSNFNVEEYVSGLKNMYSGLYKFKNNGKD